jgi:hypothetical protein
MNLKPFSRFMCLAVALVITSAAPIFAADQSHAKHTGNISKRQAEKIALNKIRGGTLRSAELQVANGSRFWAVYVVKGDSKNAKEVRVDAKTGKILGVQTEKPEDQAEEPPKKQ